MNEVWFIRGEMAGQRRRARLLAATWSTRNGITVRDLPSTYDVYFSFILDLESRRVHSHLERLGARSDLSDAERRALERCAREFERLVAGHAAATPDIPASTATTRNAQALTRLCALAEELETIAESRYAVDDWRRTAHVDADSIFEERRLHAQVGDEIDGAPCG